MQQHAALISVMAIVNLPVYFLLGWILFDSWEGFFEAIRFWLTPDFISWWEGEGVKDWWAELRLGVWVSTSAAIVSGEIVAIHYYFPTW